MTIRVETYSMIGRGLKCGTYGGILGGITGGNLYVLSGLPLHMLMDIWGLPVVNPLIAFIGYGVLVALATVVGGLLGLLGGVISGFIAALISLIPGTSTVSWSLLGAVLGGLMGVATMVLLLQPITPLAGIGTHEIVELTHLILCGLIGGCIGGALGGRKFEKLLSPSRVPQPSPGQQ